MDKNYELWYEEFDSLTTDEKVELLNKYHSKHYEDDRIYPFDEFGLEDLLGGRPDPLSVIQKACCGNIKSMGDEYIRFTRSGNLESLSKGEVEEEADKCSKGIYEEVDWSELITMPDDEEE
jgi:hypothetical protein